jgi:hypothetical protein
VLPYLILPKDSRKIQTMNRVVARFFDGHMVKGLTNDFIPGKEFFHVTPYDAPPGSKPLDIRTQDLKALFFVRELDGNPAYHEKKEFDGSRPPVGRKIRVKFKDGEILLGTTQGYQPGRPGFFLVPADPKSNIERCYVVCKSTDEVTFI